MTQADKLQDELLPLSSPLSLSPTHRTHSDSPLDTPLTPYTHPIMKTSASVLVLSLIASSALARQNPPAWADWGQRDTLQYLQDHNVPNPGNLNADQLKELAKRHWEETATGAQVHFDHLKATAYDAYSDSELRKYLLSKGVVSPQSKREELIKLAKDYGFEASKTVDSTWAKATDAVEGAAHAVADNASAAFYAVVDAPGDAYDYVSHKFDGSSRSVFSFPYI